MSRKKHLTNPPQVDAISGPDRIDTYAYKYQTYLNTLSNYKDAIKQRNENHDNLIDIASKAFNYAVEKTGPFDPFNDARYKRFTKIRDSYPGYKEADNKDNKSEENYNVKRKEYNEAVRVLGQATIDKYRNTNYDILNATNWGGEDYLASLGVRESRGAQEVANYFNSYANSPGIDRIIKNQGKIVSWFRRGDFTKSAKNLKRSLKDTPMSRFGVFDVNDYSAGGVNIRLGSARTKTGKPIHVTIIEDNPFRENNEFPYYFTLPHEMMHNYNNGVDGSKVYSGQDALLNLNKNTNPGHDSKNYEKHSDLEALRFMLYKYGIYDSRGTKDATPEDIQKLRDKYPDIRPLKQMDNEKAAWMLNNVAQNNNKKRKHLDEYYG